MNELQAKLARRREMNGEAGIVEKVENTNSTKYVPDPKALRVSPKSKSPTRLGQATSSTTQSVLPSISNSNSTGIPKPATGKLATQFGKLINVAALDPNAPKPLFLTKQKPVEVHADATVEPEKSGEVKHPTMTRPSVDSSARRTSSRFKLKSGLMAEEMDSIPDIDILANTNTTSEHVPADTSTADITSRLLAHRENVLSISASVASPDETAILPNTANSAEVSDHAVSSTETVESKSSSSLPTTVPTAPAIATSRSSLFDDDDDDEVFKRVIIKPAADPPVAPTPSVADAVAETQVEQSVPPPLQTTISENFDLHAVADAVKEVDSVVAAMEEPVQAPSAPQADDRAEKAPVLPLPTVVSSTEQMSLEEVLVENAALAAKNAELELLVKTKEERIAALLAEIDELKDQLSDAARAQGSLSFYKPPAIARKSFGNGIAGASLFGEDEGDKLSTVQTRIQRKLDHLKFSNISDSTILDLFAAPLDAKNDALNTSDIVLQGLDELLPSTGAGYSSPSATGISEQSLVASSVFGGKAGEESTPTETSTDPKEEFPSVASDDIYQEFVSKLMLHECKVLVDEIRKFLESILGPFGDGQPPDPDMTVHPHGTPIVPFYGSKDIAARCTKFFDMMTETFKAHRLWKDASEERLMSARDCLEKYVMTRVFSSAWNGVKQESRDAHLSRRIKMLRFLRPENLDIKPCCVNEAVWTEARDELSRINNYKSPGDKVHCVVRCVSMLFHALANHAHVGAPSSAKTRSQSIGSDEQEQSSGDTSKYGADDFLPVFIWIVLTSYVKDVLSNCEYIQSFHSPYRLMSRAGYCLVNLQSAAEFIDSMDASSLSIDPQEFAAKLTAAEKVVRK